MMFSKEQENLKEGRRRDRKSIYYQIQMQIGKSVVLVLLVLSILATYMVYGIVTDANDEELKLESQAVSYQLAEFLAPFDTMTDQLAGNVQLQLLMKTLSVSKNMAKHSAYADVLANMQNVQALDPESIQVVWMADVDASAAAMSDGYMTEEGWDITTRPWYDCIEKGETVFTVPYVDSATGETVLTVATPVYDSQGKALGVAGMDISLETMMEKLAEYTIGNGGYVMLIAEDGTMIYHPDSERIGMKLDEMNISTGLQNAVSTKTEGILQYHTDGQGRIGYLASVRNTGYLVVSCISTQNYYMDIISMVILFMIIFAVGLIVIIFSMRRAASRIVKPLGELNTAAMKLAEGNLDVQLDVSSEDEVGDLGRSIRKTVARLKEYINYIDEISEVLVQMAEGKLAITLQQEYVGEFQKVKEALLHISESIQNVMQNIKATSEQVSVGSDDLARAAQGLAEGAEKQAAAVEELVNTAVRVAKQVEENKGEAENAARHTNEVAEKMEESQRQMQGMREAMDKIQETSNRVVGIIAAIEDIAEQTNLLSLNASIEAARAGEAGKGFAVVAMEIGKLAAESAKSVNTTRELIGVSMEEIQKGNVLVEGVVTALTDAVDSMDEANAKIRRTAENAVTQMQGVKQIRNGVEEMSQSVQDNSAMAEQTSATSEELAAQAVALNELVQMFE